MISEIVSITPQVDGRSYVRERHTDQFGGVHEVEYLAEAGADHATVMADHAATLDAELKQAELDDWLTTVRQGKPIPVDGCRYCTRTEAFTYCFHELVFNLDVAEFHKAAWMVPYFSDEEFTAMGFTSEQTTSIRKNAATLAQADVLLTTVAPLEAA